MKKINILVYEETQMIVQQGSIRKTLDVPSVRWATIVLVVKLIESNAIGINIQGWELILVRIVEI